MKEYNKIASIFFMLTLSLLTPAVALADGPGWTEISEVTRLVATSNGGINVRLTPELQDCTSQSGYGAQYASIYPDHPGIDKLYSLLIAAQVSKAKVRVFLTDDTCKVGEAVLGGSY